jgi:hypothetical protein
MKHWMHRWCWLLTQIRQHVVFMESHPMRGYDENLVLSSLSLAIDQTLRKLFFCYEEDPSPFLFLLGEPCVSAIGGRGYDIG